MKAILMAAGYGGRISQFTDKPKSMLEVAEKPLIRRTVEMLIKNNIEVVIIVGYKGEVIEEELKDLNVKIYYNPFYRVTNSIASLWIARDEIDNNDLICCNADVFWQEDILDLLLNDKKDNVLLIDKKRIYDGDYFFNTVDDKITEYGKELPVDRRTGEYVGIGKITKEFASEFKKQLDFLVKDGDYNLWWENVLYSMIDEKDIFVTDVGDRFWSEIDYKEDYYRILDHVKSNGMYTGHVDDKNLEMNGLLSKED